MNQIDELTNVDLTIVALNILGASINYIDVEDIAVKVYELSPSKFGWKRYPEKIDKGVVLFALKDAIRKFPKYIQGSIKKGYMLTNLGLDYSLSLIDEMKNEKIKKTSRKDSLEYNFETERLRMRNTVAFRKYSENKENLITIREFNDFVKMNEYFPDHLKKKRFSIIEKSVESDNDLYKLWKILKNKFAEF